MAEENDIVLKIAADTEQVKKDLAALSSKIKSDPPGKDAGDAFGSSFALNLIAVNQGLQLASKIAAGIGDAFQKGVDLAVRGEEINAIGLRFKAIAEQSGLAAESISRGIEGAVAGTVDMEEALKAASGSMIVLGENGSRIPQMFELAKKASMQFGGDVIDIFNQISRAVASGSTRSLGAFGLNTNADKAYEDYARKIGVVKENLSEAQKQQALLNAVLATGNERFKNINSSITPLAESIKKSSVAVGELGDSVALVFSQTFGKAINKVFNDIAVSSQNTADWISEKFGGQVPSALKVATREVQKLSDQIESLEQLRMRNRRQYNDEGGDQLLEFYRKQLEAKSKLMAQEQAKSSIDKKEIDTMNAKGKAQQEETAQYDAKLERLRSAQGDYEKEKAAIEARDEAWRNSSYSFDEFTKGFADGVIRMSMSMKDLGKQIASTFVNGFTNAFAAVGKALVTGENVFSAFGSAILAMLGNVAMQMGSFYIAAGTAALFLNPAQGIGMIAAGAALGVLGGVLTALAGSGGGSPAGGSSTNPAYTSEVGGGYGSSYTSDQERMTPQTGVNVVVNGNIFDNKESALQIAQLLNDSFDLSGTLVRSNA